MVALACILSCLVHPLHTTLSTLTYDRASTMMVLTIRAFSNDVGTAAAHRRTLPDAYVQSSVTVTDAAGHSIALASCGTRQTGDVSFFCLRAPAARGPSGMAIANRALFDLFDDQINIVTADYDGRHESMLFTKGDSPRRLP